jgi:GAF domain-containing protein
MSTDPALDATTEVEADLYTWRTRILNSLLIIIAALTVPPMAFVIAIAKPEDMPAVLIYGSLALIVVVMAIFRRLGVRIRAWGLLLVGYSGGILALTRGGLAGDGRVYLMALPVLALVLVGRRSGIITTAISLITFLFFAGFAQLGWLGQWMPQAAHVNPLDLENWLEAGATMALLLVPLVVLLALFVDLQKKTLGAEHQAIASAVQSSTLLQEHAEQLENANRLLAAQAGALSGAVEIARQGLTDEQSLLEQFANLLLKRFGLYYAGLYLLDAQREYIVLRAASAQDGQKVAGLGGRLPVSSEDLVGQTARSGSGDLLPVAPGSISDLPNTRWRAVLPLKGRLETTGVLDIHFDTDQAPSKEQVQVLRTLADQLAISLENVRLFRRTQESIEAERRAYGELSRQAWAELLSTRPDVGFLSDEHGIAPAGDVWLPQMETAFETGEIAQGGGDGRTLAIPIKVRGQVIGVLDASKPASSEAWSEEEIGLLQTLTEQLGTALEGARLYQDTQRRATRERLIGEVTARMRESLDVERVLQAAVREFGKTLGADEVKIRLTSDS